MTRNEHPNHKRAVVQILDQGRRVVGTGFFVSHDLVATCAHVVQQAIWPNGRRILIEDDANVEIRLLDIEPSASGIVATVVERSLFRNETEEDIAFLRVRDTTSVTPQSLTLTTSMGAYGAKLRGFAYPAADPKGLWMEATVVGPLEHPGQGRRLQLKSTNISGGCSGGPLWDDHGNVVGMVVAIIDQESQTGRFSDTAKAIASESLAEVHGSLILVSAHDGTVWPTNTNQVGHHYEASWAIQQLIRVLSSDVDEAQVQRTPGHAFELMVRASTGNELHQVKRQHETRAWTLDELDRLNTLDSFRTCLDLDPRNVCVFVSVDRATELHELGERARLDISLSEFAAQYLLNSQLQRAWSSLLQRWSSDPDKLLQMVRRTFVRTIDDSTLTEHQRLWLSAALVRGTLRQAQNALLSLIFDAKDVRLGREHVVKALERAGVELRSRAIPRINPPDKQTPRWNSDEERILGMRLLIAHEQVDASTSHEVRQEARDRIISLKRTIRQGRPPAEGDILAERFVLVRLIGSGGFAGVWLARDRAANFAPVALKLLHLRHAYDQVSRVDRFFRGARIMARLQHPNIVRILVGTGHELPASYFFVMEHLPGPNLLDALASGPELRVRMGWLHGLALALDYAHENNVVHRDVKPQNVVLDGEGVAKLTDFDLTWATDTSGGTEAAPMGSLIYGAPEVLEGSVDITPRSDVYSYAITAIAILSGKEPPGTIIRSAGEYLRRIQLPELSEQSLSLLERSTSWESHERPRSALVLYNELASAMGLVVPSGQADPPLVESAKPVGELTSSASPLSLDGVWKCPRGIEYVCISTSLTSGVETELWMSRMPITVAQFKAFVDDTGAESPAFWQEEPQLPVVGVTWHQARAFATWARAALPTVLQWKCALCASALSGTMPTNSRELDAHAWYALNAGGRPHPCGEKAPNSAGLYDLLGNVWEWSDASDSEQSAQVYGGSYQSSSEVILGAGVVSRRNKNNSQRDLGFRVVWAGNTRTSKPH